jgi:serine/threonine protein kinase
MLLGRYELLRPLARGGMAEVFLARRRGPAGIEKRLVVKRIRPERAADPRFVQMFLREARLSVSLAHENIVPVFDFGRAGNELFLAMEHVEGCDLATALERSREPLDPVLIAYLGVEACQGLDYAHRKRDENGKLLGVVHRDVTPRNLLLSLSGEVKLTDFGVAAVDSDMDAGKLRGTPAYMSPEQARGEAVDARSDVFALGLVLWEALEGRRAYGGQEAKQILAAARAGQVPELTRGVPDALREVVRMATRVDLGERYADARAMQAALDGLVIAARASDRDKPAPSHRIAAWVKEVLADAQHGDPVVSDLGDAEAVAGPFVTYAENGVLELEKSLILDGGGSTMRSMALTAAEDDGIAGEPDAPLPSWPEAGRERPATEPVRPSKPRTWRAVYLAGLLPLFLGALWMARRPAPPVLRAPASVPEPIREAAPTPIPVPVTRAPAPPPVSVLPTVAPAPARPRVVRSPKLPSGHLKVNSTPWSYVTIDGGAERHETPFSIDLAAGTHLLRFANPVGHITKTRSVTLESGQTLEVVEALP